MVVIDEEIFFHSSCQNANANFTTRHSTAPRMLHFTDVGRLFTRKPIVSLHRRSTSTSSSTSSNSSTSTSGSVLSAPSVGQQLTPHSRTALADRRAVISVVGQERDGVFLVARDDLFINRTCIELVEIKSTSKLTPKQRLAAASSATVPASDQQPHLQGIAVERSVVYVHDNVMKCVAASINHDKTILAFTTFKRSSRGHVGDGVSDFHGRGGGERGVYDSFLVEVERKNGNNRFHFNIRGSQFQNIQVSIREML